MRERVTIDEAINLLNEAVRADRQAMHQLVETRTICNSELAKHPTIQVVAGTGPRTVGILGILNGLFGVDEESWGPISAVYADDGRLTRFARTKRER